MANLTIPKGYRPVIGPRATEGAIHRVKSFFQDNLAFELNLVRVTAPLFVLSGTGINDDLNGIERPVSFAVKDLGDAQAEIVHSLAKWKRLTLADLGFGSGEGLYTDMNAIRADEVLDNTHSLYVDQWDWERVMGDEERNLAFLKAVVRAIYDVIRRTERFVSHHYPEIEPVLPPTISFVHTEELEERWPDISPREREDRYCKEHGAAFVIGIGAALKDGRPHDGRAPDYDDWSTETHPGHSGLNGDIVVHNPLFDRAYELSSMGIRVNPQSLDRQLDITDQGKRRDLDFHRRLLAGELPQTIGGGIGQSRLCMFYLRKAHIGEIQSSLWPEDMRQACREANITLL